MLTYTIVVLGAKAVGKTSLAVQFTKSKFVSDYQPTIADSWTTMKTTNGKTCNYFLLDTSGNDEHQHNRKEAIRQGYAFVIVYSTCSRSSFNKATDYYNDILRWSGTGVGETNIDKRPAIASSPIIVIGNKNDMVDEREVGLEEGERLARQLRCPFTEISAKNYEDVAKPFMKVVDSLRKNAGKPVVAGQPSRMSWITDAFHEASWLRRSCINRKLQRLFSRQRG